MFLYNSLESRNALTINACDSTGEKMTTSAAVITIRPAVDEDFAWVMELMHSALEPYYGGDHRAHARRIFDAHISGGKDIVGFFSFEQRMLIGCINNQRAGMIHVVGKRQSTYKISPLIVDPSFQGHYGLGSRLLQFAESYARENQARQIYCTVAASNKSAMQFFLGKGFIKAGSSASHYKSDVTEVMLYKPIKNEDSEEVTQPRISVLPLDEHNSLMLDQVRALLLAELPSAFEGITDQWVDALFRGYERRDTNDVNSKFKLIFVALDPDGNVVGIAGATPKKGSPIKVMPLISKNARAFEALLIDVPHQLVPFGHKLYIHITPTVQEVMSLQRLGWSLDAALPSAYREGVIAQQWSLNIGAQTMRTMRVKQRFYDLISSGRKSLEVRVGYPSINRITAGEQINLLSNTSSLVVRVREVRQYATFELMLREEPFAEIAPDAGSNSEVLALLQRIYPREKEQLGVVVLALEPIKSKN